MIQQIYDLSEMEYDILCALAGVHDENFRQIEKELGIRCSLIRTNLYVEAPDQETVSVFEQYFANALKVIQSSQPLDRQEVARLCLMAKKHLASIDENEEKPLLRTRQGKLIFPKTKNQKKLIRAFSQSDIVFASGVAGTGKTYLAVAYAVSRLKKEEISKIILTRPAVEAGESLGFLPGDMKEKVDPYLRPLYDALNEFLGPENTERLVEKEVIEIAPLAFMRGRTLNDAVVILDEAQNTTRSQMKMFLTRMGRHCQMIINGDVSQIDLIKKADSGLLEATQILQGIDGISILYLDESDVVRNPLVQKIIARYAENE